MWVEVADAQPSQGGLHSVDNARAFPDQALALPVRALGVLFGNRRDARHAANGPVPHGAIPKNPRFSISVSTPVAVFCPAISPAILRDTRGMDHCAPRPQRALSQRARPNAIATSFEGKRNPRDLLTGPDCLIAPAMQQAKQPFGTRLQLLCAADAHAGKHPWQPASSTWLISTTAMIVLYWSKATRDLLKACPGESRGRWAGASGHSIS